VNSNWYLESIAGNGVLTTHPVDRFPYRIGRGTDNELSLQIVGLSRHHSVLEKDQYARLVLTDLNSTNGSRVNRKRVEGPCILQEGDVLHFGLAEFRLKFGTTEVPAEESEFGSPTLISSLHDDLPMHFIPHEQVFHQLLMGQGLVVAAQPIVDARDFTPFGFELLGRANLPPLPAAPSPLFELASVINKGVELSAAFRQLGIEKLLPYAMGMAMFVNTHPLEIFTDDFYRSLCTLKEKQPELDLVVEISESAVSEVEQVKKLSHQLASIGVRFAYDDFGAGLARLNEMSECPAHFVKFDMTLIQGLDQASDRKQQFVADLVRIVRQAGSVALAEGVETQDELDICRDMGFSLIQGYFTGRPVTMDDFHTLP
jgi:EAL domain-containing protein (putative c-di-GMP-specific phosphodiesterase class I)